MMWTTLGVRARTSLQMHKRCAMRSVRDVRIDRACGDNRRGASLSTPAYITFRARVIKRSPHGCRGSNPVAPACPYPQTCEIGMVLKRALATSRSVVVRANCDFNTRCGPGSKIWTDCAIGKRLEPFGYHAVGFGRRDQRATHPQCRANGAPPIPDVSELSHRDTLLLGHRVQR